MQTRTSAEVAFLNLGEGAHQWRVEAGATGIQRIRSKMSRAVELAAVLGTGQVDEALGYTAIAARFDDGDLVSIMEHLAAAGPLGDVVVADEQHSAQPGTSAWGR